MDKQTSEILKGIVTILDNNSGGGGAVNSADHALTQIRDFIRQELAKGERE